MHRSQIRQWLREWWVRIVLLTLPLTPYGGWQLSPAHPLSVLIIDKTVPAPDWREHLGLTWILDHEKVTRPDGGLYDPARDYYGYHPLSRLGDSDLTVSASPDLIYVADTYGLTGYGGLKAGEWDALWNARGPRTTLIVEFNAIASPTDAVARAKVEADLKIAWTGWAGRYFTDLGGSEVPAAAVRSWERQQQAQWRFRGKGVLLVSESDQVVVLPGAGVMFTPTPDGTAHHPGILPVAYPYWFDIVTPAPGLTVEAYYDLGDATALRAAGLPSRFPAVIASRDARTYYFAGDYADRAGRTPFRFKGIAWLESTLATAPEDQFYWRVYVPMMTDILADIEQHR